MSDILGDRDSRKRPNAYAEREVKKLEQSKKDHSKPLSICKTFTPRAEACKGIISLRVRKPADHGDSLPSIHLYYTEDGFTSIFEVERCRERTLTCHTGDDWIQKYARLFEPDITRKGRERMLVLNSQAQRQVHKDELVSTLLSSCNFVKACWGKVIDMEVLRFSATRQATTLRVVHSIQPSAEALAADEYITARFELSKVWPQNARP